MELTPFEEWKLRFSKSPDFQLQATITSIATLSLKTLRPQIFVKVVKVGRQIHYTHKGKAGVVQHLMLSDNTGDIRISLFNEFVNKFEKELKLNHAVCISDFVVKKRNSKAGERSAGESTLEITANIETKILGVSGDVKIGIYPKNCEDFHCIISPHILIDVVGLVIQVHEIRQFETCHYKEVDVVDKTGKFTVKLWNDCAEFPLQPFTPIIVKLGKLTEFNGSFSIDVNDGDLILTDGIQPAAVTLREWFETASTEELSKLM